MLKRLLTLVAFSYPAWGAAQGAFMPLGSDAYHIVDRLDIKYSRIIPIQHTADKSYYRGQMAKLAETLMLSNLRFNSVQQFQIQWLADEAPDFLDSTESRTKRPLWKLYREPASFAHVTSKNKGLFDLRFNPIFDLKMGIESYDSRFVFTTSRGVEVRGNIRRVLSFYFNGFGNAARHHKYITDKIRKNTPYDIYTYVPGQAYWKDYSSNIFKFNDGIDYFDARGYINANILKYINVSFGRDKFFIGNGQRSFFLSDFSAPYLFLRTDVSFWRFRYQSILAELTAQYIRGADQLLPKKYMAVHHLSIQPTHFLNFGLFEGVVMQRSKHFELQYLNPVIFYRAVEHALGSPDNVLLGADFKANVINHLSFYGQFLLDEFNFKNAFARNGWWANKWALQLGMKYIDIAPNLDGQIEMNLCRPFMYTHEENTNFTHYNQPLAHPLGANFIEVITQLRYQPLTYLTIQGKLIAAQVGEDTLDPTTNKLTNLGADIFRNSGGGNSVTKEYGNKLLQGARSNITFFQLLTSYQPWHNVYLDLEILYRAKRGEKTENAISNNYLLRQSTFGISIGARMNFAARRHEF
ncbi:MAG: hypothetical protein NZM35_04290 [Chitinophagales bacterium]|nr:hypothetical protein [Chitinophagales bacterium]